MKFNEAETSRAFNKLRYFGMEMGKLVGTNQGLVDTGWSSMLCVYSTN